MVSGANFSAIRWTGDLNDDCQAEWSGLLLRAEQMDRTYWWWAVYDAKTNEIISDSHGTTTRATNGKKARAAAEAVARVHLEKRSDV
jgi:uncharacterized membrane protein